ncbi:MAG: ferritin-like domain-containing protein [Alphaproteobacteria bacterium]|nr:ferritin-like domain-containing protein [Alphaproteobacteria bacterium]
MLTRDLAALYLVIAAASAACVKRGCETDADCANGYACLPVEQASGTEQVCVETSCRVDEDCGGVGVCAMYSHFNGCFTEAVLMCTDPAGECAADTDCADGEQCLPVDGDTDYASLSVDVPLTCATLGKSCASGRPLVVGEEVRAASLAARGDWATPSEVALPDAAARSRLASWWATVAAMEHASVASFARASLELMALGAPPDLLRDTHLAAMDEVEHARLAYGLVERFSGAPAGPGPLSLEGVAPATDVGGIARALIREGCVGETVGAALALAQSRACEDPALAAILSRIADDEARHAELAWRTLRWLVAERGIDAGWADELVQAEVLALKEALDDGSDGLGGWGLLSGTQAAHVTETIHRLLDDSIPT